MGVLWIKLGKKLGLFLLLISFIFCPCLVFSTSVSDLEGRLGEINQEIRDYQSEISQKRKTAQSLEEEIVGLNQNIDLLNDKITETQASVRDKEKQIVQLSQKIEFKKKELEKEGEVLDQLLCFMYEVGDTPTMEIILASNSFSEALDQLENMSWIEKQIEEKIESIEKAKKSIEDNLAQQKREKQKLAIFNSELETEKAGVSFHLAQKNSLLAQTEGQEEKYREYLVKAEKEFQRVQAQITSLLAVESYVSQGSVKRGQVIGFQGSTGFSTGPHLHFGVYIGNQDVDPIPYLNSGRLSWPFDSFIITQYYWGDFSHRGRGWPGGLDLVSYPNAPVKAAADGEIILNIRQNWGFGHYIVIEHGDGLRTLYAHLQ